MKKVMVSDMDFAIRQESQGRYLLGTTRRWKFLSPSVGGAISRPTRKQRLMVLMITTKAFSHSDGFPICVSDTQAIDSLEIVLSGT